MQAIRRKANNLTTKGLASVDHLVAPKADYLKRGEFAAWFDRAGLVDTTVTARNQNSWRGYARRPLS